MGRGRARFGSGGGLMASSECSKFFKPRKRHTQEEKGRATVNLNVSISLRRGINHKPSKSSLKTVFS